MAGIEKVAAQQVRVNDFKPLEKKENFAKADASAPAQTAAPAAKADKTDKVDKQGFQQKAAPTLSDKLANTETANAFKEGFASLKDGLAKAAKNAVSAAPIAPSAPPAARAEAKTVSNDTVGKAQILDNKSSVSAEAKETKQAAKLGENRNTTVADKRAVEPVKDQIKELPKSDGAPTAIAPPKEANAGDKESRIFQPQPKAGEVKSAAEFLNDNLEAIKKAQEAQPKVEAAAAGPSTPSTT